MQTTTGPRADIAACFALAVDEGRIAPAALLVVAAGFEPGARFQEGNTVGEQMIADSLRFDILRAFAITAPGLMFLEG